MEELKRNQILIEISEDKKNVTVTAGCFFNQPMTFDGCPSKVVENLGNALKAYDKHTGLSSVPEWSNERCGHEGGKCKDCN